MNIREIYFMLGILVIFVVSLVFAIYPQTSPIGFATIDTSATIVNTPPVLSQTQFNISEGSLLNLTIYAYDPNFDSINVTYNGSVNGTNTWLTDYLDAGVYNLTANVSDGMNHTIQNITIVVYDVPCAISAKLNSDQQSIDLIWSNWIGNVSYTNFTIFYSSDLINTSLNLSSSQNITTTLQTWTDVNADTVQRRYYNLYGKNTTETIRCPITVGKYDKNLTTDNDGWNLIALPFIPANNSRDEVMRNVLGNVEMIYHFNRSSGSWNYWNYTSNTGSIYNLTEGTSYTIRALDNVTLIYVGELFTNTSYYLTSGYGGWNPFGWIHEETGRYQAFFTVNSSITWIYDYNSTTGNWNYWYTPFSLGNIQSMLIGEGYFVKSTTSDQLDYEMGQ